MPDQERTVVTEEGDTVDLLAWRAYGDERHARDVWRANPGLAARGAVLPAGVTVRLPAREDLDAPSPYPDLWD